MIPRLRKGRKFLHFLNSVKIMLKLIKTFFYSNNYLIFVLRKEATKQPIKT